MDFDIDAALDQLEKSIVNQTFDETQTNNQTADVNISSSTTRKSADDLLLIDLDPLAPSNHQSNENPDDRLQRLKFDIQELYAVDSVNNSNDIVSTALTDVSTEQDEMPTMTLPEAVEQLEIEVRQEILQHAFEASSSSPGAPLTDQITGSNDDEDFVVDQFNSSSTTEPSDQEQPATLSLAEEIHLTATKSIDIDSDFSQQDHSSNPSIIHSVDSIVNAMDIHDLENVTPVRKDTLTNEVTDLSGAVTFTAGDDDDDDHSHDDAVNHGKLDDDKMFMMNGNKDEQVSLSEYQSPLGNFENSGQDFDLVKNVLSEILDRPEEINLDDTLADANPDDKNSVDTDVGQVEHTNLTINNGEFRFLDEMLSSIDVSDADIQQLSETEMERIDMMLKQIVNNSSPEMIDSQTESIEAVSSEHFQESEPPQNVTSTENSETTTNDSNVAAASAINMAENSMETTAPIDEELVRVEQEWSRLTEEDRRLGSIAPQWVNDDQAPMCMKCNLKFTLTRRRHHCRACGKVFCSTCCSQKVKLIHDDNREDRACNDCIQTINRVEYLWTYMRNNQKPRSSVLRKKQGNTDRAVSD